MIYATTLARKWSSQIYYQVHSCQLTQSEPAIEYEEVTMVSFLPIRDERVELFRKATSEDETLQMLKTTIITGWPDARSKVPEQLTPFFSYRDLLYTVIT